MPVNFNNFSDGGANIAPNSFLVGFDSTQTGGEKKWSWINLRRAIRSLATSSTYTGIETVIGCTQTGLGYFSKDTVAIGAYNPVSSDVRYLADFNWQKQDGNQVVQRMEGVTPLTYKPWQNFFPYKPESFVVGTDFPNYILGSTKMTVRQGVMDNTTSTDVMDYTLHVNWVGRRAFITGRYTIASTSYSTAVFNRGWVFNNDTGPQTINTDGFGGNTLGERNVIVHQYANGGQGPYIVHVNSGGIHTLPVWNYAPAFNETSNVSIFIENTYLFSS
jgi:hypothetical protein